MLVYQVAHKEKVYNPKTCDYEWQEQVPEMLVTCDDPITGASACDLLDKQFPVREHFLKITELIVLAPVEESK